MNKKSIFHIIVTAVIACAIICIIFVLSAQNGKTSANTSGGLITHISELIYRVFGKSLNLDDALFFAKADHILRKAAHFSEYALLGISVFSVFTVVLNRTYQKLIIPMLICYIYAGTDEIHQFFVPGRSCAITDVLIDFSGAVFGILCAFLVAVIIRRLKISHSEKNIHSGIHM